jgi:adenine-specific DNA-methyltransferase
VEDIIWKNKYGAGAKTTGFISVHEHIFCYSKQPLKNLDVPLSLE